jgi:amidase
VALSCDLGLPPVDPEVAAVVMTAGRRFAEAGVLVEEAHPDLSGAPECFQVLRALSFATGMHGLLENHRGKLKPEVIWNIEKGLRLTVAEIARAETHRAELFHRMRNFFEQYDLLLCPAAIVPPFPVENRYVEECGGVRFETYIDWLAIVSAITLTACPALSIPAGFTRNGLPVGIQIVAPCRAEARLLAGARILEDILGLANLTPIDPRVN